MSGKKKEEKFFLFEENAFYGLFMSLIFIYSAVFSTWHLSCFAGVGLIFSIIWAADAVRKISKYGLGTGVPSVGMFGIGLACVISLFSISLNTLWSPLIGAVLALIIGWGSGKLINKILDMNIPSMEKRFSEITAGCTLAMTASFIVVTGSVQMNAVYTDYISTGVIALGFIGCAVAVFHAYNANLGPDEVQDRTKMLSMLDASMVLLILGIAAFFLGVANNPQLQVLIGPAVTIFMSIVSIFISYYKFWTYVKRDAWKITETGLLPSEEDLN